VSDTPARGWEAVDHAEERLQVRAAARQRAADRRRRRRGGAAWVLRILLPVLGAAAVVALVHDGRLEAWSAAVVLAPAVASGWLGRREGPVIAVLWALVTLAAEIALIFAVGLVALDLGPS
jgi:hypothetical protein